VSQGACVWLTGRSGVGKSTIAAGVAAQLRERGRPAAVLDDPEVGRHLDPDDLVGALTWLSRLLVTSGVVVVVAVDTPARDRRELVRTQVPRFVDAFVDGRSRPDGTYA
jgi:adenylylsulfate kinase-like enzyme